MLATTKAPNPTKAISDIYTIYHRIKRIKMFSQFVDNILDYISHFTSMERSMQAQLARRASL
jgi:hypothetical protein